MIRSDTRLHVLHVIGSLQLGGAETLLFRLAKASDADVRHEVICLGDRGWYSDQIERQGVTVHHLGMVSAGSFIRGIPGFARLMRKLRPDVIQSWMYLSNVIAGLFGRTAGIPVVWGIHGSTLEHLGWPSWLCAYAGGVGARWLTDQVVNCSAGSAELHRRLGYNRAPATVVRNGYEPTAFFPDETARTQTRDALGLTPDQFVIGSVARWHSQKDIPNLLEAAQRADQQGARFKCLLIGAGLDTDNEALAEAIRAAGCDHFVRRLGPRRDLAKLVQALDFHVLASSGGEAFPNVVAETMLAGKPNAVTDVGDSAVMVGETGWVVPPRSPDLLGDAIAQAHREWRNEPEQWRARGASARVRIAINFTAAAMRADYLRIWRSAGGRSSRPIIP